jgi:hypothetical protein
MKFALPSIKSDSLSVIGGSGGVNVTSINPSYNPIIVTNPNPSMTRTGFPLSRARLKKSRRLVSIWNTILPSNLLNRRRPMIWGKMTILTIGRVDRHFDVFLDVPHNM